MIGNNMNPKQYETNVLITESVDFEAIKGRLDNRMIRLLHAGLGLSSELAELAEATANLETDWVNLGEEIADLAWYVAVAVNTFGFDHNEISKYESVVTTGMNFIKKDIFEFMEVLNRTVYDCGDFNDLLKKHIFYGRELNVEKIKACLEKICADMSALCYVSGYTIEDARKTNIDKLRARYGEKFTEAAALNRNLEVERSILENCGNSENKGG
jgi:hypothetical protein